MGDADIQRDPVDSDSSVTVSGTVAVSAIAGALPAGTNNIGDVDLASMPSALGWTLTRTAGSDPAAGAEATVSVPANELWEILYMEVTLVTSATVNNRETAITISQGGTLYYAIRGSSLAQVAGATKRHQWLLGQNVVLNDWNDSGGVAVQPHTLPDRLFVGHASGMTISTSTRLLDAGDNYGALFVVYRRWPVAPPWYVTA